MMEKKEQESKKEEPSFQDRKLEEKELQNVVGGQGFYPGQTIKK